MTKEFTISIDSNITEQQLMEDCLNKKYSGYDWRLLFFFYALGNRWHIDKLNYYLKMLEGAELTGKARVKKWKGKEDLQ